MQKPAFCDTYSYHEISMVHSTPLKNAFGPFLLVTARFPVVSSELHDVKYILVSLEALVVSEHEKIDLIS